MQSQGFVVPAATAFEDDSCTASLFIRNSVLFLLDYCSNFSEKYNSFDFLGVV